MSDYCRYCRSHHRMSEFCNEDGRTEPRLVMTVTTGSDSTAPASRRLSGGEQ